MCSCEKKVSVFEGNSMYLLRMFVLCMFKCIREKEIQGAHSPPWGLLSAWLGLCQAIWGAPVLYGARVKNGNANK